MKLKNSFNLESLKKPFDFPTHPEDGIRSVRVTMLRLISHNGEFDITLKTPKNNSRDIYQIIGQQFNYDSSVIIESLTVREIVLNIELESIELESLARKKTANLSSIKLHSCGKYQLTNFTRRRIYIVTKYLKYWRLVDEHHN